jgi:nucleotide-binding universal stress UspA family protein
METILVPTDFSPVSNNAADYAAQLARFFSARIVLVNAYPFPPANYEMGFSLPVVSAIKESSEERLEQLKAELCAKHGCEFEMRWVAEMGAPYDVIESVARQENADLVVMGITGEAGALKQHLVGSTALKVARSINIPAFIIPQGVHYQRIHKISFACDLDHTEETDLVYVARYFSKIFDAELEIVHVERPDEEITVDKARTNFFVERKLENVNHRTVFITGRKVGKELEEYFSLHQTDLVMLSPKKHNVFHYLFHDSITTGLAFHLHVPLLAIH